LETSAIKEDRFCLEIRPFGNYCPFDCKFCYQEKLALCDGIDPYLAAKTLECVLDYMSAFSMGDIKIVFHGGEPAYDKGRKIFEITDLLNETFSSHGYKPNVKYLCHTSGFCILDISGFASRNINICINRPVPNSLSKTTRIILENNIENLLRSNILNKQLIVLTNETLESAEELLEAISLYHLPTKLIPQFPSAQSHKDVNCPDDDSLVLFLTEVTRTAAINNIDLSNVEPLNRFINWKIDRCNTGGCRFSDECPFSDGLLKSFALDNDGSIYACNRFAGIKLFSLKPKDEKISFENIVNEINRIKNIHNCRKEPMKKQCKTCSINRQEACPSTGGCPFFMVIHKNDSTNMYYDPYCSWESKLFCHLYSC
jgi:radical SAM protein with 4Fe4S-binding SPASM domain